LGTGSGLCFLPPRGLSFMRTVAAVVALVVCVHAALWVLLQRQEAVSDFRGVLPSISYTPYSYSRNQHPEEDAPPTAAQIRTELSLIAPYTRSVRTYSSTGGVDQVAPIAAELGLKTWVGIWLDDRAERDGREIAAAIELARRYNNVTSIVVGNETIKTRALAEVAEIRVGIKDRLGNISRVETIKLSDLPFDEPDLQAQALRRLAALERAKSGKLPTLDEIVDGLKKEQIDAAFRAKAEKVLRAIQAMEERGSVDGLKKEQIDAALRAEAESVLRALQAKREKSSFETVLDTLKVAKSVEAQIAILKWVKRHSPVPVTSGQIWTDWRDYPELAASVDFISAHILPYWEPAGLPASKAVDAAIADYDELRQAHPGKRIVIAEFGWPSAGYNNHSADPGRAEQALVLRDFAARAEARGIDYNLFEAFDQPWKINEGSVGAYWGLFDASHQAKFAWTGLVSDANHWRLASLAVLLGLLLSVPILAKTRASIPEAATLATAANTIGAWFATVFAFWDGHYFVWGAAFAFALGVLLLIPLVFIALARVEEIASLALGHSPRRLIQTPLAARDGFAPKVSIHIPAYREPPEMLKATLDAVARLQYPDFECIVVINNTPDPAYWAPIEEHCRVLGERFKFINVENLQGFKAGALRLALAHSAPDASIIGVIDADYVVHPGWLKDLVPAFVDPQVALVQAPQDHRDGDRTLMHHAMNGEYAGFFDIGMVRRNEANAIITHGTMCLMRRAAIEAAGGWSSDTICEDTDLGLTMLELGWQVHYTNRRYGHGLLPDTFEAYKKQRQRWAYGGFQILKKHWRSLLPKSSRLTREQKREFALGWLNWLGAESIGVAVAILNLVWVPVVAFAGIAIPDKILTIPILAAFALASIHFLVLYRLKVAISLAQMACALLAAMSVQWTVARSVGYGILTSSLPFMRTAKGGATRKGKDFPAFWEGLLAALLLAGSMTVLATNYTQVHEINIFAGVLLVQSLPFLAAVTLAMVEGSRFNEFAYWRHVEAKVAENLPRPAEAPVQVPAPLVPAQLVPAQLPADSRIEAQP
jgi:cellulose synthase/poly-beta-1,6-N-acetylglucosamine synthase-like glycosyltransferase/exo-beta-1,3-glucanase (GH17 family)